MALSSAERKGDARERLLARLLDVFGTDLPSPEMSLREVAAQVGTSHALLRYHFGSLSGVLAAMLTVQRSRDNAALLKTAEGGTFDQLVHAIWRAYSRPEQLSRVRGFFHVAGLAAYRPEDFREFIDSLGDLTDVLASLAENEGHTAKEALRMATVTVAAMRGLLLQEVLTPGVRSREAVAVILRMNNGPRAGTRRRGGAEPPTCGKEAVAETGTGADVTTRRRRRPLRR